MKIPKQNCFFALAILGILSGCSSSDSEEPKPVSLTIDDVQIEEGFDGSLTQANFTISLSSAHSSTVSVNFNTEDGDAISEEDYQPKQGTITIPAGSTTHTISIYVIGDIVGEEDETFNIRLHTPVNGEIKKQVGIATILNDDPIQIAPVPTPVTPSEEIRIYIETVYSSIFRNYSCRYCHLMGGAKGAFADANVSIALNSFLQYVNPADTKEIRDQSTIVTLIEDGHACWSNDCAADTNELRGQIDLWVERLNGSGTIEPNLPEFPVVEQYLFEPLQEEIISLKKPDPSRDLPDLFQPLYTLVTTNCSACHGSTPVNANVSAFAHDNINTAFDVVSTLELVNLSFPELSDLYIALTQQHECWNNCDTDAAQMLALINEWSNDPSVTAVPFGNTIPTSGAIRLAQSQVMGSEMRYDRNLIAKYKFTEGMDNDPNNDSVALDSSGHLPAIDLTLNGNVQWLDNFGIRIEQGGSAISSSVTATQKLYDLIVSRGEFSIEAWIKPLNSTQTGSSGSNNESAVIMSYGFEGVRNFTFGQDQAAFQFFDEPIDRYAAPAFATPSSIDYVQPDLQHIVLTYSSSNGRRLFINSEAILCDTEIVADGNDYLSTCNHIKQGEKAISPLSYWDPSLHLLLGNDDSGANQWLGDIRFLAIHKQALTQKQILHNFDAGVGLRFHLLFDVSNIPGVVGVGDASYIWFKLFIDDNNNYIIHSPMFVDLDLSLAPPINFSLKGIKIGINGREADVAQPFSELGVAEPLFVSDNPMTLGTGSVVIPSELGPMEDQFFLIFDEIAGVQTTP
ncbi:Calx-beta domain-containing protein [Kaarinaea lacus]